MHACGTAALPTTSALDRKHRHRGAPHMKPATVILPLTVGLAIVGAFFAGRYVGAYDAGKLHARGAQLQFASERADRLHFSGAIAGLLRESKTAEALRVVEQQARVDAPAVQECLQASGCKRWVSASEERSEVLKHYADVYGRDRHAEGAK